MLKYDIYPTWGEINYAPLRQLLSWRQYLPKPKTVRQLEKMHKIKRLIIAMTQTEG